MVDIVEVRLSNFVRLGFSLSLISSLVLVAAAVGYRWELWSVRFALLTLTKYATYGALAGAALSMVGIGKSWPGGASRGLVLSVVGVIIGMGAFYTIFEQWKMVRTSPFIHDISTDTENPPEDIQDNDKADEAPIEEMETAPDVADSKEETPEEEEAPEETPVEADPEEVKASEESIVEESNTEVEETDSEDSDSQDEPAIEQPEDGELDDAPEKSEDDVDERPKDKSENDTADDKSKKKDS